MQKIEVGNVSMPVKNSLISGAQSLFGVKTELQFGRTKVSTVFSEQKSQTRSVAAQGGSIVNEFELRSSDYDDNKHFFISQFFRDNFNNALLNFPLINSPVNITKIEVWVTNKTAVTQDIRNIVAFADLAENKNINIFNPNVFPVASTQDPSNEANSLINYFTATSAIRNISTVSSTLLPLAMLQGRDFSVLENARKLSPNEFKLHPQLGFLSLSRRLNDGDILAVAYEYTISGSSKVFKVGELTSDGVTAPANIIVKLLRSEIVNTSVPIWKLMMKNIYALGTYQIQPNGFRFELLYKDDATGVPLNVLQKAETVGIADKTLLNLFSLDRLNTSLIPTPKGDGFFDYVEGTTIDSENGLVIFPKVEPFGADLKANFTAIADDKYVFNELYTKTVSEAKNNHQEKDKYLLKGYFKSESASGIPLGAFNVPQGSVKVTSGGRLLVEGIDYVVDYQIGRVKIINPSLSNSDTPIQVSVENNSAFNLQSKTFLGVNVEHIFSDKLIVGATILNLNEKPITQKAIFGYEPINNTIFGFNANYNTEVPFLTKLVNKLPNIDTDVASNFSVRGDFAYLLPGSPKRSEFEGESTSYLEDFEGSEIPLDIKSPLQWFVASTPQKFPESALTDDLQYGKNRAKLSWYTIDQLFYGGSGLKPKNIDNVELSRAEVRRVNFNELFPQQDLDITQSSIVRTLDLAYFPNERGSFNYDTNNLSNGVFTNPQDRWGGIMRSLITTDFEQANVEYIQFWMQDPYYNNAYSIKETEGLPVGVNPNSLINQVGELYFNLGNVSEDIIRDGKKMYENGLPADGSNINTTQTNLARVPSKQSLIYAFSESDAERVNQDLGLDGLDDAAEITKFGSIFGSDPSSDNYRYFRGSDYDAQNASVISRYKQFNNTEGNSPTANNSKESYPTSATSYPDVEDINRDQTMNTVESYYEYKVSLNKNDLVVGQNKIVDERIVSVVLEDGSKKDFRWLQFRIPVTTPDETVNGISGFSSIRFIRMFLTKFKIPIVLRFAELQLVRGDWRRFQKTLNPTVDPPQNLTQTDLQNFEVGVVNIEENETKQPIPYVLPPGTRREILQGSTTLQQQNEQSLLLKVNDLIPNESRAVFKNVSMDLRMYKRLKMFIHAEGIRTKPLVKDNDLQAIIRLGSDLNENYYQIEIPLKITNFGAITAQEIWPSENNFDVLLEHLTNLKLFRFKEGIAPHLLYPAIGVPSPIEGLTGYEVRVKGNPNLSNVKTMMLGVKNNSTTNQFAEIWFNELRVSDFDNQGGWAAVIGADANFADFANVSLTGRMETKGFGTLEQRVNERNQKETKLYDVVTSVNLGKVLPKDWGLQIPMNYARSEEFRDPKYDPQYQDVLFEDAKDINPNSNKAQDHTKRTSFSFLNVRKEKSSEKQKSNKFYDIENISASYAFNEMTNTSYEVQKYLDQNLRASLNYNHSFKPWELEPLKKATFLNSKYLKLIQDFNVNFVPTSISLNSGIIRSYNEQLSRSLIEGLPQLPTLTQRHFMFDWDYSVNYNLTKSLQFTFRAVNNYLYDDFDPDQEIKIFDKFFTIGRPKQYHQTLNGTYKIPLQKLPLVDFVTANYTYTADFDWQASSSYFQEQLGNTIQNANTHNLSVDLDMNKFYRNIGLTSVKKSKNPQNTAAKSTNEWFNSVKNVLTAVKKARLSYSENNGTLLPGYVPEIGFLGRDNYSGSMAPTLGFVFGSQIDIRNMAIEKGWLLSRDITDPYYNKTYSQTHFEKLDVSVDIKPNNSLDIELLANKIYTSNRSQQLDIVNNVLDANAPVTEFGNFSSSFLMIGTAFKNYDQLFDDFKNNRTTISERLAAKANLPTTDGFGVNSQQVMLPAFLAAYAGQTADGVKLSAFRDVPMPNWKVNYKGFMQYKWFKDHFRSFTISHSYRSLYSITNFSNNLQYQESTAYINKDISGNFYNKLLLSNVNLIEEFSPLIKIDMRMQNSLSFKGEIRKDRAVTLNFNNNTVMQVKGLEYVFGVGYRIKDVQMRFRIADEQTNVKGDINLKLDVSLRDNITLIRSINEQNDQITGGQRLLSLKFLADYALSKNLTSSFYFDQNASSYALSTSFPRKSIGAGISVRYIIGN
ncbi:MAG: cell surface protein SprA [Flavobacteriaceae bacterium]|nr:cell surface protein SprA [Flavobacteriaceae bacterium]